VKIIVIVIVVNRYTYYITCGVEVKKTLDSKGGLQGHSRLLALVPCDRLHTIFH